MAKYKLEMKPSEFTQAFLTVQGKKFWFADPNPERRWNWREYLLPIYDNLYRYVLLKTGRQVEKSTFQAGRFISFSCLIPNFRSVYVAPTAKQARVFSNDRLRKMLRTSKFIKTHFIDTNSVDQVFEQTLINESTIFIGFAYHTADTMRGLSADLLGIDEFQDIISDNIPILRETLTASDYKLSIYTGTPKTFDNHIEKEWQDTFQAVWVIPCTHCKAHNRLDTEPRKLLGKNHLICKKCGKQIYTQNGYWLKLNPNSEKAGFHISQLQTGRIQRPEDWKDLLSKCEKYPEAKVYNEVFGLPYDSSDKPITLTDIRLACQGVFLETPNFAVTKSSVLFAGIDWGENKGSFTVLVIGGFIDGNFQIVHFKKYSPLESKQPDFILRDIIRRVNDFRVMVVGCDHGAGHKENLRLINTLGRERVWEIFYSNQKELWKWDEERAMYIVDRTMMMDNLIIPILTREPTGKQHRVVFPEWSVMSKPYEFDSNRSFANDFTSITKTYSERSRKFIYDHDSPDDGFQATAYCKFVAHLKLNIPFV